MSRVWMDTWGWGQAFTTDEIGSMLRRTRGRRDKLLAVSAVYGGGIASIPFTVAAVVNWEPLFWAIGGVVLVLLFAWGAERKAQRLAIQLSIARLCE